MEKSYSNEIQNEYNQINNRWLKLHYDTSIGIVIFAFLMECIMGYILHSIDEIFVPMSTYFIKYLVIPTACNIFCIIVDTIAIRSKCLSTNAKVYIISLMFVVICFILFTIHIIFSALYFVFAGAILLTTIYGNYKLTTITAIFSVMAVTFSEIHLKWDSSKLSIFESSTKLSNFVISLFMLFAFAAICMVVIRFEREKNAASIIKEMERYQLQERVQIDELTGIYNRIAFRNAIRDMEEDNSGSSYIFVMIDLDNFKTLNDNMGHIKGDQYLSEFGRILESNCKDATPFRYGGDEFCMLFHNSTIENAVDICERIQKDFRKVTTEYESDLPLTASFGIASFTKDMTPNKLVMNTDKALYEAKKEKNTIHIFDEALV